MVEKKEGLPDGREDEAAVTWASPEGSTPDELIAQVRVLQHRALIDRDTIVGLEAQLKTLQSKMDDIASTDVATAFARVDRLVDEQETLTDKLNRTIIANKELVDNMRTSTTWRVGSIVTKPLARIKRLGR